ncbi:MAG TPA: hypothetical protein VL994_12810 [Steroidobacteraceae bacterium]|nr:hypothetical protein [Steroidobacteraceae bacterium]
MRRVLVIGLALVAYIVWRARRHTQPAASGQVHRAMDRWEDDGGAPAAPGA